MTNQIRTRPITWIRDKEHQDSHRKRLGWLEAMGDRPTVPSSDGPQAPPPYSFDMAVADWLPRSVPRGIAAARPCTPHGSLLYI